MTEAPNDSFTPPKQQQHSLVDGVAESKGGLDADDGDGFGGRVGDKSGVPLHGKLSAFDTPPETLQEAQYDAWRRLSISAPSSQRRAQAQKRPFEAEARLSDAVATGLGG